MMEMMATGQVLCSFSLWSQSYFGAYRWNILFFNLRITTERVQDLCFLKERSGRIVALDILAVCYLFKVSNETLSPWLVILPNIFPPSFFFQWERHHGKMVGPWYSALLQNSGWPQDRGTCRLMGPEKEQQGGRRRFSPLALSWLFALTARDNHLTLP